MAKSEQIRSTKTGTGVTSLTLANADDSKLTPPVGMQIDVQAISVISSTNITNITVQDGATVLFRIVPGAVTQMYHEFSEPLRVTTGTNDMRLVLTLASGNPQIFVWYQYSM